MAKGRKKKGILKNNPAIDFVLYLLLRVLVVFMYLFDVEANLRFARFLGGVMWKYYHRGRKRALDNLRASFPEKNEHWIHQIGRRSFEHIAMLAVDVLFTPRLVNKYNWCKYSRYKNVERTKWMMQEKQGLILVTGHYGNFEIIGYILGLFGFDIYSIARPLDNRFINKYLYDVRERVGQRIIDKKGASRLIDKIIANGSAVCFIGDQDAGRKGIFADFFGRKASSYKSIGLLAITYKLPVAIGYGRRIGDKFFFEIGIERIIMPSEWQGREDALEWITSAYNQAIEEFVREEPEQYWWLHRRWKHRPKDEPANGGNGAENQSNVQVR